MKPVFQIQLTSDEAELYRTNAEEKAWFRERLVAAVSRAGSAYGQITEQADGHQVVLEEISPLVGS